MNKGHRFIALIGLLTLLLLTTLCGCEFIDSVLGKNSEQNRLPGGLNPQQSENKSEHSSGQSNENLGGSTDGSCEHELLWIEQIEPTCEEEGRLAHYYCSICESCFNEAIEPLYSIIAPSLCHAYGTLYDAKPSTFFEKGNVEYYHCFNCGRFFDKNLLYINDVTTDKISTELAIGINGQIKADFEIVEESSDRITWQISGLKVTAGDVVTVCLKNNTENAFEFSVEPNCNLNSQNNQIYKSAVSNVTLTATPNLMTISVDGYYSVGMIYYVGYASGQAESAMEKSQTENGEHLVTLTLSANDYIYVNAYEYDGVTEEYVNSYCALVNTSSQIAVEQSPFIKICESGTYTVIFNENTKTVTIVKV